MVSGTVRRTICCMGADLAPKHQWECHMQARPRETRLAGARGMRPHPRQNIQTQAVGTVTQEGQLCQKLGGNCKGGRNGWRVAWTGKSICATCIHLASSLQPRDGEPVVTQLHPGPIIVQDGHFSRPLGRTDLLRAPAHFPVPSTRVVLREVSLVWHLYGGRDFGPHPSHR